MITDASDGSLVEIWAQADRLGSVSAMTDGAGAVADKCRYFPYGKPGAEGAGGLLQQKGRRERTEKKTRQRGKSYFVQNPTENGLDFKNLRRY